MSLSLCSVLAYAAEGHASEPLASEPLASEPLASDPLVSDPLDEAGDPAPRVQPMIEEPDALLVDRVVEPSASEQVQQAIFALTSERDALQSSVDGYRSQRNTLLAVLGLMCLYWLAGLLRLRGGTAPAPPARPVSGAHEIPRPAPRGH